jgi:hypothetical protein
MLSVFTPISWADSPASSPSFAVPFSVTPVMEKNQVPGISGYVDLNVNPGEVETIHIRLSNPTNQTIVLKAISTNALTMSNGGVEYVSQIASGSDSSFLDKGFAIKNAISIMKTITVPKHEVTTIPVTITAPSSGSGSYLGGIVFQSLGIKQPLKSPVSGQKTTYTIKNVMNMAMAVQLNLPQAQPQNFSFGTVSMTVIPSGSQVEIGMKNASGRVLQNLQGSYKISRKDNGKRVMGGKFGPFTMAPQTQIRYPVLWPQTLSPGIYVVKLTSNFGNGSPKLDAEKNFSIGIKQLTRYKQVTGKSPLPFHIPNWVWVGVGLLLLLLIGIGYWLGQRGKKRWIAEYNRKLENKDQDLDL